MKVVIGGRRGSCRVWERREVVEVKGEERGQRKWDEMGLQSV